MIHVRDNRGNYHEAVAIYDGSGKEIAEVRDNQGRLLFKNWSEISGVPPLNFTSRGEQLLDYRIYGNTVQDGTPAPETPVDVLGCGERTENLFDISTTDGFVSGLTDWSQSIDGKRITVNCSRIGGSARGLKLLLGEFKAGTYNLHIVWNFKPGIINIRLNSDNVIATITNADTTFSLAEDTKIEIFVVVYKDIGIYTFEDIMLTSGSSAPSEYIPYGYKIPVTVSDGSNAVTTPIYIGSEPLYSGEYVSFKEQKIYRFVEGILTPVSAEIPAIPTIEGENILTVGTTVQPSEIYLKGKIKSIT